MTARSVGLDVAETDTAADIAVGDIWDEREGNRVRPDIILCNQFLYS